MTERTDPPQRHSEALARAWEANAALWVGAVRDGRIASRAAGTDAAIVEAVVERRPQRVLDLGCGEGWLARRLRRETGCAALGMDRSAPLIEAARVADPDGDYRVLSFEAFVAAPDTLGARFDIAVLNYALFDDGAADLLATAASLLVPGGVIVLQTLHPWTAAGGDYRDGWRIEDFAGIAAPGEAWAPMPWYFRTMQGWAAVIRDAGLAIEDLREPAAPDGGPPLSLLLAAGRTA